MSFPCGARTHSMFLFLYSGHKNFTLVHFVGNEKVAIDFTHKNSGKNIPFVRTCPSYLHKCEALVEKNKANIACLRKKWQK